MQQLYSTEKSSGVSPMGTVEESSEDQALDNKNESIQALSQEKLLTVICTQWIFDLSCSDSLCGASVKYCQSVLNQWLIMRLILCGVRPGYVRKPVGCCVALVSVWTFFFAFVEPKNLRAMTFANQYLYSWGSVCSYYSTFPTRRRTLRGQK